YPNTSVPRFLRRNLPPGSRSSHRVSKSPKSSRELSFVRASYRRAPALELPHHGQFGHEGDGMKRNHISAVLLTLLLLSGIAGATIFGSVHGLIHDPQHRPVEGAKVTLRSTSSDWSQTNSSDSAGEFRFDNVPLGDYRVIVDAAGFTVEEQKVVLTAGRDA